MTLPQATRRSDIETTVETADMPLISIRLYQRNGKLYPSYASVSALDNIPIGWLITNFPAEPGFCWNKDNEFDARVKVMQ